MNNMLKAKFLCMLGIVQTNHLPKVVTHAKFYIYTSNDGENWNEKYQSEILYGWSEAPFVKIDIKDAKYLKLVADENQEYPGDFWSNWYDETVFADAKLIKEDYIEDNTKADFIKTVEDVKTTETLSRIKVYSIILIIICGVSVFGVAFYIKTKKQ